MSTFYNANWDLTEAAARRRRELQRRAYEFDVSNLTRQAQESLGEVTRQYRSGFEPRVTNFARRGLARSGIFKRAMADYASQQQRSLADVARSTSEKIAARQLEEQESAQGLQDILDEIARGKAREIYESAANLRAWSPFTGLYS